MTATMLTVSPPPRHCTGCGARIWSLRLVTIHTGYDPARWRDLCGDCDPEHADPLELFTTGVSRASRRAGR